MSRQLTAAGAGVAVVLAAVACSGSAPTSDATSPAGTSTSASPTSGTSSTGSSTTSSTTSATASAPLLADGKHPTYIVTVDTAAPSITVDVVQFFTGPAASKAAREDGAPEVPPPNDYWIRNTSKKLRTLPVASGAVITTNTLTADQTGSSTEDHRVTLAELAKLPFRQHLFWVTVRAGSVIKVAEQFLP